MTDGIRPLPYDFLSEQAIIGCILAKNETFDSANQIIKPVDFYDSRTQRIYKSIVQMFEKDIKVDYVSLVSQLASENILQEVGGEEFITEITLSSFYTPNIETYCKTVKEKSLLRSLIGASEDIIDSSYKQTDDVSDILAIAENRIFEISQDSHNQGLVRVADTMDETLKQINELTLADGKITGVATGLDVVDNKLSGLQNSQLILLAARPAMGKTALGLTMAWNAAKVGKSVAFFSLEMSTYQLNQRLLSMVSLVSLESIINGSIRDDDWTLLIDATKKIVKTDLYVDETPGIRLSEMKSKLKRLKAERGLDLVVIDYLQLMQADGRQENRQNEIASISRGLKSLSKELNCPILSLAQLSREADKRADHRPILSDLRESGAIEQDADVFMLLYREVYYDEEVEPNQAKVIFAKHRNGATGTVDLFFNKQCTTFTDLSLRDENV
ncbi:replicative DNA helicase [uncultured Anaerococcus sp.]|uniref:replicative DNA helicase n=1 Tax=uncultured Anaerococcus sp. TaxID=293428 RepID=UPI00288B0197|nr:replicative DNA helicase [uncultured Anaerococcus sp.]